MMEGVNLTKMCCKHFCKCHNVPQYRNNVIRKKIFLKKMQYIFCRKMDGIGDHCVELNIVYSLKCRI
jgi:hypothetical protein